MTRFLSNRLRIGILVIMAAAIAVAAVLWWPEPVPKKSAPLEARVELAAGHVDVIHDKVTEIAVSGMALRADSEIRVASSARALLRLPDGSGTFVRGGSMLTLRDESVELREGEYWLDAATADRAPFTHQLGGVRVEAAESGLSLKKTADSVEIYVSRGRVTVTSDGGRAEVNAGERATVKGAEAPLVSAVAFWEDWTGGMADFAPDAADGAGRGTILGVSASAPAGSPALPLDVQEQAVSVVIRDGLSETKVEQTFFNPTEGDVEGWYWFTIPSSASVTGFALETDGVLIDGEFIEQREAREKYASAKSSGHAPAILEQIDGHTYRARIFPITALKTRKVVLRYVQLQPATLGKLSYVYPMSSGDPVKIGEFSLRVDLGPAGKKMRISTLADARIENNGEVITMRRSGFTPRVDFQLEAVVTEKADPVRLSRFQPADNSADYVLVRYTPDLDWDASKVDSADVVVVVDTSAAGDDQSRSLAVQTAEAVLRSLSEADHFALVALDVRPVVLHPEQGLAAATKDNVSKALDRLAEHPSGGATDLSALFDVGLGLLHKSTQPALVYVGDGVATSGELSPEQLLARLTRSFSTSSARLFTVGVGSEANYSLLAELARAGGGNAFRVDEAAETTVRALQLGSAIKLPTITELNIDLGAGLDQVFTSGGARVAKGGEVSVLARSHHPIPDRVTVRGKLAGKPFEKEHSVKNDSSILASFVPRLWASEYVRTILGSAQDPDAERGRVAALGVRYGLVTPYSSILALESEQAFYEMGIQRGSYPLRGSRLTALTREEEEQVRTALLAPFVPNVAVGCQSKEMAPSTESASEPAAVNKPTPAPLAQAVDDLREESKQQGAMAPPTPVAEGAGEVAAETVENAAAPADQAVMPSPAVPMRRAARSPARGGGAPKPKKAEDAKERVRDTESDEEVDADKHLEADRGGQSGRVAELPTPPSEIVLRTCSDIAARPLWQRGLLWRKRLATASNGSELVGRYSDAKAACELSDWRAERAFLQLLVPHVSSVGHIHTVLSFFDGRPDVQQYLGKLILRRTVDPAEVAAVESKLFRSPVDWRRVSLELSEIEDLNERIEALRAVIGRAPDDPNGSLMLIELLVRAQRVPEAVEVGRRIRERGFLTPTTARRLGDLLADTGQRDAAVRAYSEIVEFDANGTLSRQLLGDVYLAHAWYDAAYRQYQTLSAQHPDDPLGWLRLAGAAAGSGRVDEALRLERQVMNAQGNPGPNDPRRWARLHSAAKLARLWQTPPGPEASKEAVERKLKELQLFTTDAALVILTWEDLSQRVALQPESGVSSEDATDAGELGLFARLLSRSQYPDEKFAAQLQTEPQNRTLKLWRHDVVWDGKEFQIRVTEHLLPELQQRVPL